MNKKTNGVEFLAYSLLLIFFVGISFNLVTLGAKIYKRIDNRGEENFEKRTSISYIMMKIKQNDRVGGVSIEDFNGQDALLLTEQVEDKLYQTWIYEYKDTLREAYILAGDQLTLEAGDSVMPLKALNLKWEKPQTLAIELESLKGELTEGKITLRCTGKGE